MPPSILSQLRAHSRARGGTGVTRREVAQIIGRKPTATVRRMGDIAPCGKLPQVGRSRPTLLFSPAEVWRELLLWQAEHPSL